MWPLGVVQTAGGGAINYLDDIGTVLCAYSTKKVVSTCTYGVRAYQSDATPTEKDIAFDGSGWVDTADAWFGVSTPTFIKYYDQAGTANYNLAATSLGHNIGTGSGRVYGQTNSRVFTSAHWWARSNTPFLIGFIGSISTAQQYNCYLGLSDAGASNGLDIYSDTNTGNIYTRIPKNDVNNEAAYKSGANVMVARMGSSSPKILISNGDLSDTTANGTNRTISLVDEAMWFWDAYWSAPASHDFYVLCFLDASSDTAFDNLVAYLKGIMGYS